LQRISNEELEAMSEERRLRIADNLVQVGHKFRQPRNTSGLVEWYQVPMNWRQPLIRQGKPDPAISVTKKRAD
jgi:hypothetical protein